MGEERNDENIDSLYSVMLSKWPEVVGHNMSASFFLDHKAKGYYVIILLLEEERLKVLY